MTSVELKTPAGKADGTVELPAEIFDVQANVPLMHQVVVAQLAAARQGTHDTKTRGQVAGGGKKPYRQKGTGRARQGSRRAPHFAGGGVVFGPHPRSYEQRLPRKMKTLALRGALTAKLADDAIKVIDAFGLEGIRTRDVVAILAALNTNGARRILVVAPGRDQRL